MAPSLPGPAPEEEGEPAPPCSPPGKSPVVPRRRGDRREPLKVPGEGGDIPGGTGSPNPALTPTAPPGAPQAAGGAAARGRGNHRLEVSPRRRLPWPRSPPCPGLIRPHRCQSMSVAPVECPSIRPSISLCQESSGPWQSPQPPINLLESSSSSGAGSQEGSGEGGHGHGFPHEGQMAARAAPPRPPWHRRLPQHHNQPLQNKPRLLHSRTQAQCEQLQSSWHRCQPRPSPARGGSAGDGGQEARTSTAPRQWGAGGCSPSLRPQDPQLKPGTRTVPPPSPHQLRPNSAKGSFWTQSMGTRVPSVPVRARSRHPSPEEG